MTLPSWCDELRTHQKLAIEAITDAFNQSDIVILDGPTGTGKTLIAEQVHQLLHGRSLYLCSSLSLQDQFVKDFPHATLLRGRSNYPTKDRPDKFGSGPHNLTAADCTKQKELLPACNECRQESNTPQLHCLWCHPVRDCPYEKAKAEAIRSSLVCTNTYYFLYEANYHGATSNRDLVIVDECDVLEDILMSFVEFHIPKRTVHEIGLDAPGKKTVEAAWVDWVEGARRCVHQTIVELEHKGSRTRNSPAGVRKRLRYTRILDGLERLGDKNTGITSGGWVYTGYEKGDITFKPIEVKDYAQDYLWRHGKKWLLMSATVISSAVLMEALGIS